jgi:hypothetical protein
MIEFLLTLHSYLRWVVLLAAIAALIVGIMAAMGSRPWDATSSRVALIFTLVMNIQFVVGLALWIVEQRWLIPDLVTWGHPVAMLAAVGLAQVGKSRADRTQGDREQGRQASIFFGASLLLMIVAIPWYSWPL